MKRIIAAIMAAVMLFSLCACGNSNAGTNTEAGSNANGDVPATTEGKSALEEILNIKSDEDPVDIYHAIMDFEEIGAEAYLERLKAENPENAYRYYNEKYYIQTITEGERKAVLEQMKDPSVFFADAFEADYPGLFIKAELNRGMDELTMHLNRAAFESNFFTSFAVLIIGAAYLDSVQAYNLVTPENRGSRLVCVDENGAVLMDSDEMESSEEAAAEESVIADAAYTLSDHVVVDNENFTFTIKSIEAKDSWGFTLKVFCENKTEKNLMFSWDKVSVMGFMADPFWASEIAAGKKANEEISFSYSMLEEIGIDAVDDITFTLRVSDSEDWSADPLMVEEFAIYPTGKTIQEISYPSRKSTDTEKVLYDTADYTVIILSSEANGGDFLLHCYLENKTGHEMMFSMDDVSVNGYMADPFWADSVAAGKKAYVTVCFYESTLAENDISTVEEIEFTLRVSNADSWDAHATEVFTYNP